MDSQFVEIKEDVELVVDKYRRTGKPTSFIALFTFLYSVSSDLVELVEDSKKIVKTAKKETVVEAIRFAFLEINPDLPWIPEPLEARVEKWLLESAAPSFIDWLVNKYNEKKIFKKT